MGLFTKGKRPREGKTDQDRLSRLPLLALPLLADGAIFLSTKVLKRKAKEAE
jgi:hypothetical protein